MAAERTVLAVGSREVGRLDVGESQANSAPAARVDRVAIVRGGFRALPLRIHGVLLALHKVIVDAVLDVGGAVRDPEDPLRVRFILREQERDVPIAIQIELAQRGIFRRDHLVALGPTRLSEHGPVAARRPGPEITEPERRQDVDLSRLGAAIVDGDLDEDVLRRFLGILDEHVEVAALIEDPGIEQLILEVLLAPVPVGLDEISIGECGLWILIQIPHVRVRRRAVQVEVVFLDVLAVVALAVRSGRRDAP